MMIKAVNTFITNSTVLTVLENLHPKNNLNLINFVKYQRKSPTVNLRSNYQYTIDLCLMACLLWNDCKKLHLSEQEINMAKSVNTMADLHMTCH